ncbi:hypothetical protein BDY17DRAFT_291652 [Neohortaea acidophila]|uniref:Uncharacterized protein n=1 Tax=Neohortaea acidophila TaxID=245834 RepID=A0A6A6Q535_9PEZI|nr:uncharacterized protein BDY17DRAFT_291652 [Neohortaea acidophila]KAF2486527.1 hypothetical protein BDY17DRAFT_291652 [Neohortaea acidophila]
MMPFVQVERVWMELGKLERSVWIPEQKMPVQRHLRSRQNRRHPPPAPVSANDSVVAMEKSAGHPQEHFQKSLRPKVSSAAHYGVDRERCFLQERTRIDPETYCCSWLLRTLTHNLRKSPSSRKYYRGPESNREAGSATIALRSTCVIRIPGCMSQRDTVSSLKAKSQHHDLWHSHGLEAA